MLSDNQSNCRAVCLLTWNYIFKTSVSFKIPLFRVPSIFPVRYLSANCWTQSFSTAKWNLFHISFCIFCFAILIILSIACPWFLKTVPRLLWTIDLIMKTMKFLSCSLLLLARVPKASSCWLKVSVLPSLDISVLKESITLRSTLQLIISWWSSVRGSLHSLHVALWIDLFLTRRYSLKYPRCICEHIIDFTSALTIDWCMLFHILFQSNEVQFKICSHLSL